MLKHLLWDFDGTFMDTYPSMVKAMAEAARQCGFRPSETEIARHLSIGSRACLEYLAGLSGCDQESLGERFYQAYVSIPPLVQKPMPGAVELCSWVSERGGKNLLVTHKEPEALRTMLAAHRLERCFDDTLCIGYSPGSFPRKPDPTAFLFIMQRTGVEPPSVLTVGDRSLDFEAGRGAGTSTCLYGRANNCGADFAVQDLGEVSRLLFQASDSTGRKEQASSSAAGMQ